MERKAQPYARTVFVCTKKREGGRISCAGEGRDGEALCESLKHAVKKAGLKKSVRVAPSGCLDLCEKGPNLFIYPEGYWYCGATLQDVPRLLNKLAEPRP